jgi:hypothetical protein
VFGHDGEDGTGDAADAIRQGTKLQQVDRIRFPTDYLYHQGHRKDEEHLSKISPKWVEKYHVVDRINGGNTNGFIDINAGITIADKVIDPERQRYFLIIC